MKIFLFLFYHFFKTIVRLSLWAFYRRTTVVNREGAKIKGPVIVISNHPSTVLDPLNVAVHIPRMVHFLANASLFRTRFTNWFFNTFYCIPIERYQDTGGKPLNNAASFAKSTRFLTGGGILYIAPEGSSYVERRVRKLKTGLARIALDTEAVNGFQLGLQILPVGLNYSDPTEFRSELLTIFGEPIRVSDFQKEWDIDPKVAVVKLTEHIRMRLTKLTTDVADTEEQVLLEKVEAIFREDEPLPPLATFERSQKILAKLKSWRENNPEKLERLASLPVPKGDGLNRPLSELAWHFIFSIVTFPFFLLGFVIHFPPCFIIKKLSDRLNDDLHWVPTFKYCLGLIIYPLILGLEIWLVSKLPGHWLTWVFILSIIPLGLMAEWWLDILCSLRAKSGDENFAEQKQHRKELMEMLNL